MFAKSITVITLFIIYMIISGIYCAFSARKIIKMRNSDFESKAIEKEIYNLLHFGVVSSFILAIIASILAYQIWEESNINSSQMLVIFLLFLIDFFAVSIIWIILSIKIRKANKFQTALISRKIGFYFSILCYSIVFASALIGLFALISR